jgi:mono/diheme cytochrome c family protein
MKTTLLILALAATPAFAAPFAKGDVKAGKALVKAQCSGCHISRFGGDGSKIYTRPDHRIRSASALAQQITTCNASLGNNLFPEDELNIAAFLNQTYYKFK